MLGIIVFVICLSLARTLVQAGLKAMGIDVRELWGIKDNDKEE